MTVSLLLQPCALRFDMWWWSPKLGKPPVHGYVVAWTVKKEIKDLAICPIEILVSGA